MTEKTKMYHTFREVVAAVRAKYEGVELLSRREQSTPNMRCLYSPAINGIGCAIGCLLPRDLDFLHIEDRQASTVRNMGYLNHILAPEITNGDLNQLQDWHDSAWTADEFRATLDAFLEQNP